MKPNNHCEFSPCRKYRYTLWRVWDETLPYCQFIGLNPSTADETKDDPTVRRCINFAKSWGYGALCMTNIFAFRATDPKVMKAQDDPIGLNTVHLAKVSKNAGICIAAWGAHGDYRQWGRTIADMFQGLGDELHCLGKTKSGQPKHPLYIKADTKPEIYV